MLKVKFFQFDENEIILLADALEHYEHKLQEDKSLLDSSAARTRVQCMICDVKRMQAFLLEP